MLYILGIESSCDDTSAAISADSKILANFMANQSVHKNYGGVVPELASREHMKNIVPVVSEAIRMAGINKSQINAIAFTAGPGLPGSLMVGVSFAKSLAMALNIPIINVDHLQAHVLSNFIVKDEHSKVPEFPFICLTVSGGHTQLLIVRDYFDMELIGETIDDAAGEAFDKAAKILGLSYPGGPLIDKLSSSGNKSAFKFAKPLSTGINAKKLNFSFSGLKTSILYFIRDRLKEDKDFIDKNLNDLCASIQASIVDILMEKLIKASDITGIKNIAVAGGVSANSYFRASLNKTAIDLKWNLFIPDIIFSTDNAAMIAIAGYYKYLKGDFASQSIAPYSYIIK